MNRKLKILPLLAIVLSGCITATPEQVDRGCDTNTLAYLRGLETSFGMTAGPKLAKGLRGQKVKAEYEVLKTICEPEKPLATENIKHKSELWISE
jgi:hypothetical protein